MKVTGAIRMAATATLLALGFVALATSGPPSCLFRSLLDWECFGCGMTRAVRAALAGEWPAALAHNRLVLAALPALIGIAAAPLRRRGRRRGGRP